MPCAAYRKVMHFIAGWCNGNTDDFDSSVESSNLSPAAIAQSELLYIEMSTVFSGVLVMGR